MWYSATDAYFTPESTKDVPFDLDLEIPETVTQLPILGVSVLGHALIGVFIYIEARIEPEMGTKDAKPANPVFQISRRAKFGPTSKARGTSLGAATYPK